MKDAMDNYAHRLTDAEDEIELLRAALSRPASTRWHWTLFTKLPLKR
jgi:hypothetical protein